MERIVFMNNDHDRVVLHFEFFMHVTKLTAVSENKLIEMNERKQSINTQNK